MARRTVIDGAKCCKGKKQNAFYKKLPLCILECVTGTANSVEEYVAIQATI